MPTNVQRFLKGTNNLVRVQLLTDGIPLPNLENADQVDIQIGGFLLISRTSSVDGVRFDIGNGILAINPAELTEDVSVIPNKFMPTSIIVYDGQNPDGVLFGGADSDPKLLFSVRDPIR